MQPLAEAAEKDLAPAFVAMDRAMHELLARYSDAEIALVLDFMTRAADITSEQIATLRAGATERRAR